MILECCGLSPLFNRDDPSSLESFARIAERVFGTDTLDLPAAKFFKPPLSLRKPQSFGIAFDFVIKRGNQTLRELHAISQRSFIASAVTSSKLEPTLVGRWQKV